LAVFGFAAAFGRAGLFDFAVLFGAAALIGAAAGFAADRFLAAAVSALDAMVIALVAAFIACRAVDIVLADEVALVAAVVILVAAEVTFAAAEETVLAAATAVGAVLAAAGLALTRALGLLVTRRIAPVRLVRARAIFAEPRRTGLRAVDCRGIDLPPVVINYGGPIPRLAATYTSIAPEEHLTGQVRAVAATAESIIDGKKVRDR
jgi:hypothetical protein